MAEQDKHLSDRDKHRAMLAQAAGLGAGQSREVQGGYVVNMTGQPLLNSGEGVQAQTAPVRS